MGSTRVDYMDGEGIKRRVLLPEEGIDPVEGIPISVPVDSLYPQMPLSFRISLVSELWAVGLVEPEDFKTRDAAEKVRAAILSVVKKDTMDILNLARELMKHG